MDEIWVQAKHLTSRRPLLFGVLGLFCIIFLLKGSTLVQPPVWDTATGVFPPAIYLVRNNYDIAALLQEPGWAEAGPNVHVLSLVTWVTAAVMSLTQNPDLTFVILHMLTFAVSAWGLMTLFRIGSDLVEWPLALGVCGATLACPVFFTQVGYMYEEIPVMACGLGAVFAWSRGRNWQAIFWCAIGALIKSTILAAIGALAIAIWLSNRPWRLKLSQIAALFVIPIASGVVTSLWRRPLIEVFAAPSYADFIQKEVFGRLGSAPDILALVITVPIIAIFQSRAIWRGLRNPLTGQTSQAQNSSRTRAMTYLVPLIFLASILAAPLSGAMSNVLILPRYTVAVLPFCILAIIATCREWLSLPVTGLICILGTAAFALNTNGSFYQLEVGAFSVVERSGQYRQFQELQIKGLEALAKKPPNIPAYYCRADAYMASDPLMGYLEHPIENAHYIELKPYRDWTLSQFPKHFILLRSNLGHGGALLGRIASDAAESPDWNVKLLELTSGPFRSWVFDIQEVIP